MSATSNLDPELLARALAASAGQAVVAFDTAPADAAETGGVHIPASAAMTGD
jgi:hypothetical protein